MAEHEEFRNLAKSIGAEDLEIKFAYENPYADRTCEVTRRGESVFVCFACNGRPHNELDYAACIANSIGWYMMYPTAERYCEASGEEEVGFLLAKGTYTNMRKLFSVEELRKFWDAFGYYF